MAFLRAPIRAFVLMMLLATSPAMLQGEEERGPRDIDYVRDVAPLLQRYCAGCHNPQEAEAELDLTQHAEMMKGSVEGAVIVPGSAEQSKLLQVLIGEAEPAMPPEDSPVPSAEEIATLRRWIEAGAPGPADPSQDQPAIRLPDVELQVEPRSEVTALSFAPTEKLLAVGRYQEIDLIELPKRKVRHTLKGHAGKVNALAFSDDGRELVAVSGEPGQFGEISFWNVGEGKLVRQWRGHTDNLYAVAFHASSRRLATGSYDQAIKIWDVDQGTEVNTLSGHSGAIHGLAFHPSGTWLASASDDRTVKLWDVATGSRLDTFSQPLKEMLAVAFSPDGRRVIAGGADNRIRLWELSKSAKEGTNSQIYSRFAHESPIVSLAYAADGHSILSTAQDGTARLWNAEDLSTRVSLERQSDWPVAAAISADSERAAIGRLDGSWGLYDVADGARIPPTPMLESLSPRGIQKGQPARLLLTGKNLDGPFELIFDNAKLSGQVIRAAADEMELEVSTAADMPRGSYKMRLKHPKVASNEITLHVDDIPQVVAADVAAEDRPPLHGPLAIWGILSQPGDTDRYTIQAEAGETFIFDVSSASLGAKTDLVLTLADTSGRILARVNDFGKDADPLLIHEIARSGEYFVEVSDLQLRGSKDHEYRLSMGTFPWITAVFPTTVSVGEESRIQWIGHNLPSDLSTSLPAVEAGEIPVTFPDGARSRQAFTFLATESSRQVEREPNDNTEQATPLSLPGIAEGRLSSAAAASFDVDLYQFEASAGEPWIFEIFAERLHSPIDSFLEILDANGQPVERLRLRALRDSLTTFRPSTSDQAGFRVTNWEEMHLDQYLYLQGEVCKIFRMPQGPDSDTLFYSLAGKRRGYFDTTPISHALDETIYVVESHPAGAEFPANGLPSFPVYFRNDDDSYRERGRDSRLTFTAPEDGRYLVRVSDVRGFQGPEFVYRLVARRPQPDFALHVDAKTWAIPRGGGKAFTVRADRIDEFDGDIHIAFQGGPAGITISSPLVIQAGHHSATGVFFADGNAEKAASGEVQLTARAEIGGREVVKEMDDVGKVSLGAPPQVKVFLDPPEIAITPGTTVTAQLRVERNGFKDRISFNVSNLPHGVIVDNIGLNGVLLTEGESERQLFLTAESWVPPTSRSFQATAQIKGNPTSRPAILHVQEPDQLARTSANVD